MLPRLAVGAETHRSGHARWAVSLPRLHPEARWWVVPQDFPERLSPWTYADLEARSVIDPINVLFRGARVREAQAMLERIDLRAVGNIERWSRRQFFSYGGETHEADLSVASGRD